MSSILDELGLAEADLGALATDAPEGSSRPPERRRSAEGSEPRPKRRDPLSGNAPDARALGKWVSALREGLDHSWEKVAEITGARIDDAQRAYRLVESGVLADDGEQRRPRANCREVGLREPYVKSEEADSFFEELAEGLREQAL